VLKLTLLMLYCSYLIHCSFVLALSVSNNHCLSEETFLVWEAKCQTYKRSGYFTGKNYFINRKI